jgi:hypothetical protein
MVDYFALKGQKPFFKIMAMNRDRNFNDKGSGNNSMHVL